MLIDLPPDVGVFCGTEFMVRASTPALSKAKPPDTNSEAVLWIALCLTRQAVTVPIQRGD